MIFTNMRHPFSKALHGPLWHARYALHEYLNALWLSKRKILFSTLRETHFFDTCMCNGSIGCSVVGFPPLKNRHIFCVPFKPLPNRVTDGLPRGPYRGRSGRSGWRRRWGWSSELFLIKRRFVFVTPYPFEDFTDISYGIIWSRMDVDKHMEEDRCT